MAFSNYGYNPQMAGSGTQNPVDSPDSGIKTIQPASAANNSVRNSFIPPNLTSPFYNASGVYGNLGSYTGAMVPQAASFMNQLWNPNLNNFEQSFLDAGSQNAAKLMQQGLMRVEDQFEGTPMHSSLPRMQGEVINQYARDLTGQAGQMGMQRQQLGAQMSQFPFQATSGFAGMNTQNAQQLYNLAQNQYNSSLAPALSYWAQAPFAQPITTISQGGGKM